jgi:hypothetical protein
MTETRTATMLQRVPAILAVTAHSYGLELKAAAARRPAAAGHRNRSPRRGGHDAKPVAHR